MSNAALQTETMTRVCELEQIAPDTGVCALVDGQQVAIFRIGDNVYAISNSDPFSGANVLSHSITCCIKGQLCIASPIYKQHFCLTSGQCLEDQNVVLDTWTTEIIDGVIYVV
jgi:NAD(P)H-dependent nitrite reductase small subunit